MAIGSKLYIFLQLPARIQDNLGFPATHPRPVADLMEREGGSLGGFLLPAASFRQVGVRRLLAIVAIGGAAIGSTCTYKSNLRVLLGRKHLREPLHKNYLGGAALGLDSSSAHFFRCRSQMALAIASKLSRVLARQWPLVKVCRMLVCDRATHEGSDAAPHDNPSKGSGDQEESMAPGKEVSLCCSSLRVDAIASAGLDIARKYTYNCTV